MYEIDMALIYDSIIRLKEISKDEINNWVSYIPEDIEDNLKFVCIFDDVYKIDLRNSNEKKKIEDYVNVFLDNLFNNITNSFSENDKNFIKEIFKYYIEGKYIDEKTDKIDEIERILSYAVNENDNSIKYFKFKIMYELLKCYNEKPALYNKKSIDLTNYLKSNIEVYQQIINKTSRRVE